MATAQILALPFSRAKALDQRERAAWFYCGAATLFLALTFIGFQQFYLHGKAYPGRDIATPIRTLISLHGIFMTGWVLLFLLQPLLIILGNPKLHRMIGLMGTVFATLIVLLGFRLGIESTRISPPDMLILGMNPKQFMVVPVISILIFAGFVTAAIWYRHKTPVHQALMLMATLSVMSAPISRIDFISELYAGTMMEEVFGPFYGMLLIGGVLLIIKRLMTKICDAAFVWGYIGLVLLSFLMLRLAATQAWQAVAEFLLR